MKPQCAEIGQNTDIKVSWKDRVRARPQTEYLPPPKDYGWCKRIIWYHLSHGMKNAPSKVKITSSVFLFVGPFAGSFAGTGVGAILFKPNFESYDWLIAFVFISPAFLLVIYLSYLIIFVRRKIGIRERIRATAIMTSEEIQIS